MRTHLCAHYDVISNKCHNGIRHSYMLGWEKCEAAGDDPKCTGYKLGRKFPRKVNIVVIGNCNIDGINFKGMSGRIISYDNGYQQYYSVYFARLTKAYYINEKHLSYPMNRNGANT